MVLCVAVCCGAQPGVLLSSARWCCVLRSSAWWCCVLLCVAVCCCVFAADPPDAARIPGAEVASVTVALLTCAYRGREFVRVGSVLLVLCVAELGLVVLCVAVRC
jgi:hypothetical protein